MDGVADQPTVKEVLARMDDGWAVFWRRVQALPRESYRRLRREVARLSNEQLAAHDSWAAAVISGNTDRHYAEHAVDLDARVRLA